ncbi:MAG: VWA domain-containing protein [Deltaproteobacteria bacterium]|nr:VWA domain-containing protein [Deltaproteobacteria bacterium]
MRSLSVLLVLAGCGSAATTSGGYSPPPAQVVGVDLEVSANFAAMDEVPVSGGELRLVAPRPVHDADGRTQQAIGFPLRHTDIHARVAGPEALYTVTQTFENPFDEPIDAVYVFPLGDEAAVTRYSITIGDRTIAGEIQTKEQARKTYEVAKAKGHTAALLEQEKRNIFKQKIANIAPHEQIAVQMQYAELLGYSDGQYEIVAPLVVGPRYLPEGASGVSAKRAGEHGRPGTTAIPYADAKVAGSTVSFSADIDAGVPVLGVSSPSHQLAVQEVAPTKRRVTLAEDGELPNRDLIVRYKTAGDQTIVGLLAHRPAGDKKGYFTLVVQPKATYKTGDITAREVMIVIDTSGSMNGQPLAQATALASVLVDSLGPGDVFNVMAFSGSTNAMEPQPIAGDARGKAEGKAFLGSLSAGGGTEMGPAMAKALETKPGNDRVRLVYFLTDGFVGNDDMIVSAAKGNLGANRIFSIGIGSAPNRALLDQIAEVGRGFPSYLNLSENAADVGGDIVRRTAYPYLTDIKIEWNGLAVGSVTPAAIPDVYAGMPLVVAGVYTQPGRAKITVTGAVAGHRVAIPIEVTLPDRVDDEPVAALYARKRIDELYALSEGQPNSSTVSQITELGLGFHMVTDYTSFVAVDRTRVVSPDGHARVVEQPALVPAGVDPETSIGPAEEASPSYASSSSGGYSYSGGGGGGSWGGGGDVDPLTLLLAIALVPLAWTLRKAHA